MIRIAAVGDIHVAEDTHGRFRPHWLELDAHADVLLLAGDLTNVGNSAQAQALVDELLDIAGCKVGIAGAKGFGGGFAGACGHKFGEPEMKAFMQVTENEAHSLEENLRSLRADYRVALLHYAPVKDTLAGERLEIHPFLGAYQLGEALDRAGADLALHGHAHHGAEKGVTPRGIPVRNVAMPLIKRPYAIYTLGSVSAEREGSIPRREAVSS